MTRRAKESPVSPNAVNNVLWVLFLNESHTQQLINLQNNHTNNWRLKGTCGCFFGFYLWSSDNKRLTKILLAGVASVWLFFPSCMLTWNSSFALAAIIVTQLTTPYIRIAPAAGDDQLTGQMFKYRQVIMPILSLFLWLLFPMVSSFSAHKQFCVLEVSFCSKSSAPLNSVVCLAPKLTHASLYYNSAACAHCVCEICVPSSLM